MPPRVVITGMGVLAPNAHGLSAFTEALRNGTSGVRFVPELEGHGFRCHVAAVPQGVEQLAARYFSSPQLFGMNENMVFAAIAALDCWEDAGLSRPPPRAESVETSTGAIIGTIVAGLDTTAKELIPKTVSGQVRRLGSTVLERIMTSNASAAVAGMLGLGGHVTANSSACATGTEALVQAYHALVAGRAERMLAGGSESSTLLLWAGFDSMRLLASTHNHEPEAASRPLSASASGFVPGAGAGVLMLETLDSALGRGAPTIYGEVLGGHVNCGGQRAGGTMTAPSGAGVQRCIRGALDSAGIAPEEIDLVNGHLTGTFADPHEVRNWQQALAVEPRRFPRINGTKSLIGHAMGAAGSIECIAGVLQLHHGFVHGTRNCEDLHPDLQDFADSISVQTLDVAPRVLAKASFGFGDVNACIVIRKWE